MREGTPVRFVFNSLFCQLRPHLSSQSRVLFIAFFTSYRSPLSERVEQAISSQPRVGSDIRASYKTAHSVYLLSDDPEISHIFNSVFYLFVLFIFLSYIFILYIYLFIYLFIHLFLFIYLLFSAVCRPFPHFTDTPFRPGNKQNQQ